MLDLSEDEDFQAMGWGGYAESMDQGTQAGYELTRRVKWEKERIGKKNRLINVPKPKRVLLTEAEKQARYLARCRSKSEKLTLSLYFNRLNSHRKPDWRNAKAAQRILRERGSIL